MIAHFEDTRDLRLMGGYHSGADPGSGPGHSARAQDLRRLAAVPRGAAQRRCLPGHRPCAVRRRARAGRLPSARGQAARRRVKQGRARRRCPTRCRRERCPWTRSSAPGPARPRPRATPSRLLTFSAIFLPSAGRSCFLNWRKSSSSPEKISWKASSSTNMSGLTGSSFISLAGAVNANCATTYPRMAPSARIGTLIMRVRTGSGRWRRRGRWVWLARRGRCQTAPR